MSTRIASRFPAAGRPLRALLAVVAVALTTGCGRAHTTSIPSGLCAGSNVVQEITLVVDTVRPQAGEGLAQLQGTRHDLTISLFNPVPTGACPQRYGAGTFLGELPQALRNATTHDRQLAWRVEGVNVGLNLNFNVMDNNIAIMMPLDGGDGSWSLNTIAGPMVVGRALVR